LAPISAVVLHPYSDHRLVVRREVPWTTQSCAACRRGSILIRSGKGGRRREVGMDEWGWEQLRPWLTARTELPVGPQFCIIDGPTRGRPWSGAAGSAASCAGSPPRQA
jgi:hypothetical protein